MKKLNYKQVHKNKNKVKNLFLLKTQLDFTLYKIHKIINGSVFIRQ